MKIDKYLKDLNLNSTLSSKTSYTSTLAGTKVFMAIGARMPASSCALGNSSTWGVGDLAE